MTWRGRCCSRRAACAATALFEFPKRRNSTSSAASLDRSADSRNQDRSTWTGAISSEPSLIGRDRRPTSWIIRGFPHSGIANCPLDTDSQKKTTPAGPCRTNAWQRLHPHTQDRREESRGKEHKRNSFRGGWTPGGMIRIEYRLFRAWIRSHSYAGFHQERDSRTPRSNHFIHPQPMRRIFHGEKPGLFRKDSVPWFAQRDWCWDSGV